MELDVTNKRKTRITSMAVDIAVILLLSAVVMIILMMSSGKDRTLTYSVYPYLPDTEI